MTGRLRKVLMVGVGVVVIGSLVVALPQLGLDRWPAAVFARGEPFVSLSPFGFSLVLSTLTTTLLTRSARR